MRILILNYEFPPLGGGAANATYNLLKEFAKYDDLQIDAVVSSEDSNFKRIEFAPHITVYKLPIGKKTGGLHYQTNKDLIVYTHKAEGFIKGLLKENKYHLCHAFFAVPCGYIAYRFRKNFPYIVSLRGSDVPGYNLRFSLLYKFITPIIKKVWHNAYAVAANSEGLKKLAQQTDNQQAIEVIYNGIDTDLFKPTGSKDNIFRILCVARLIERKGIKYLIEATAKLVKDYNNIKLVLAGEGNIKDELQEQAQILGIEKQVEFKGLIEKSGLPEIYNQAKVFVLPSLNEGMSNTILEAMACGLPIIATNTGGTQELVCDNGFVVPMKDSNAIYSACAKLIDNEGLQENMGNISRQMAQVLSWRKVAGEYISIYKRNRKG